MSKSSDTNSETGEFWIDHFIEKTWKRDDFLHNANKIKQGISDSLQEGGIKHTLSARAKDKDPLKKKLLDREDPKNPYKSENDIIESDHVWDLAGARVLVYFPDDILAVLQKVMERFPILASPSFVRDGKREHKQSPVKEPFDIDAAAMDQVREDMKGPWQDQVKQHWKHHGYTAVHLTVLLSDDCTQAGQKCQIDDLKEAEEVQIGQKIREEKEQRLNVELKKKYRKEWTRRVEIQISTVAMHAWSEVAHDLIYKNPKGLPPDLDMNRLLDAINGLSITSETLLEQVQHTVDAISAHDAKRFDDAAELDSALNEWYSKECSAAYQTRVSWRSSDYTPVLRVILASSFFSPPIRTRGQLRPLLRKHKDAIFRHMCTIDLRRSVSFTKDIDLSRSLLCALGGILKDQACPWGRSIPAVPPGRYGVPQLHNYLLVANIISMAALLMHRLEEPDGSQAWRNSPFPSPDPSVQLRMDAADRDKFGGKISSRLLHFLSALFQDGIQSFDLIINILLTGTTMKSLGHAQIVKLDRFVDEVFSHTRKNPTSTFTFASALAHMSFFITPTFTSANTRAKYQCFRPSIAQVPVAHPLPIDFSFLKDMWQQRVDTVERCLRHRKDVEPRLGSMERMWDKPIMRAPLELNGFMMKYCSYVNFRKRSFDFQANLTESQRVGAVCRRIAPSKETKLRTKVGQFLWITPEIRLEYLESIDSGLLTRATDWKMDVDPETIEQSYYWRYPERIPWW